MKKILVPCDFSAPSKEAFRLAVNIATKNKGMVLLLHVINIPMLYDPSIGGVPYVDPNLFTDLETDARKNLDLITNTVKSVKVTSHIEQGDILYTTKRYIDQEKVDLVIMGTHGATGWNEVFIGSNTEKIVHHSPVPVLVVRTAPEIGSIKKILVPNSLKLDQNEFIKKLKELQDFFNATLQILLVNTPSHFKREPEAQEALEKFARHYELKDYTLHFKSYMNEEDGIINFAIGEKADLIAMATHSRKGLAHLFSGSVAEDVVNHIQCPVWTYSLMK